MRDVLNEIAKVAEFLWKRGWAEKNGGNMSYNVTGTGEKLLLFNPEPVKLSRPYPALADHTFIVTATGMRMRDVAASPLDFLCHVTVGTGGKTCTRHLFKPETRVRLTPTSEMSSHLAIHEFLSESPNGERAVVHTHPDELIALSHNRAYLNEKKLNAALWGVLPEVKVAIPDGVAVVPYELPGSEKLAKATIKALKGHSVALWEKHGCLAAAKTADDAFDLIDIANKAARIHLTCLAAGYKPEGISQARINELEKAFVSR